MNEAQCLQFLFLVPPPFSSRLPCTKTVYCFWCLPLEDIKKLSTIVTEYIRIFNQPYLAAWIAKLPESREKTAWGFHTKQWTQLFPFLTPVPSHICERHCHPLSDIQVICEASFISFCLTSETQSTFKTYPQRDLFLPSPPIPSQFRLPSFLHWTTQTTFHLHSPHCSRSEPLKDISQMLLPLPKPPNGFPMSFSSSSKLLARVCKTLHDQDWWCSQPRLHCGIFWGAFINYPCPGPTPDQLNHSL